MKTRKAAQLKNGGYAMVTVIIVIAFISILATTLLYVSGMNFQMKSVDYHLKENFYESEEFLEAVKAEFVDLVSQAADQAYSEVMVEAVSLRDSDMMQKEYNKKFFDYIKNHWSDIEAVLKAERVRVGFKPDDMAVIYMDSSYTDDQRWDIQIDQGYMNVKGFLVRYTNTSHYTCHIDTDFRITAPKINWPVSQASTSWDTADDSSFVPTPINFSDCVNYTNWVKK